MSMEQLQEAIYNDFIAINKQDSNFTFWLIIQKRQRFNKGGDINKGYINVGVVKIGSKSNLQLVGFHFPVANGKANQCSLHVVKRSDDGDINTIAGRANVIANVAKDFLDYIFKEADEINAQFLNSTTQDIKGAYDQFWEKVQSYDNDHGTKFYDCLKIDKQTFNGKFIKNQEKFAAPSTQTGTAEEHTEDSQVLQNNSAIPTMPLNQILYGPPGTGKTYNTVSLSVDILEPGKSDWAEKKKCFDEYKQKGQIVFTTFHQSMSYEDFVEGIKPEEKNGQIVYSVKPGIFKALCDIAYNDLSNPYVLIIDEINRGNVSQIFGELITLLEDDKRLGNEAELKVKTPYSQSEFGVPNNLYIIGTMNTADRSVEALDSALRRRFCFTEMMPRPELLTKVIGGMALQEVLETINKRIVVLKDREHQIGHSYFLKVGDEPSLKMVFKNNIIPLLQEYFYGNYDYIRLVLGEGFMKPNERIEFACQPETDVEQPQYRLLTDEEWKDMDIIDSIRKCLSGNLKIQN